MSFAGRTTDELILHNLLRIRWTFDERQTFGTIYFCIGQARDGFVTIRFDDDLENAVIEGFSRRRFYLHEPLA